MIRKVIYSDVVDICEIYNHYVQNTVITFEEEVVSESEMWLRIQSIEKKFGWWVFLDDQKVVGYAYANLWKTRAAYKHTLESTIYLHPGFQSRGIGSELYRFLLSEMKKLNVHVLVGVIALPNEQSVALHKKLGFVKCAHVPEVGWKFGQWIDIGYWYLKL